MLNRIELLLITLALTCSTYSLYLEYKLVIDRITCENDLICNTSRCTIEHVSRFERRFGVKCRLREPIHELKCRMQLFARLGQRYQAFLIDIVDDVCKFFELMHANKPNPFPLAKVFYDEFKQYTNMLHPCPYTGDMYLMNYTIGTYFLPSLLPTGQYRLNVVYSGRNESRVFAWKIFFSVVEYAPREAPKDKKPKFNVH